MKFAALGRTHWLLDSIRACVKQGHTVTLIATAAGSPEYKANENEFRQLAQQLKCPFLSMETSSYADLKKIALSSGAEVAISVNWPIVLKSDILEAFPHGVINAHGGDLPRFRGNACQNWAILSGEKKVVVSLHKMVPELDAGPILLQRAFKLTDKTVIADVYDFMSQSIPDLFAECLTRLAAGRLSGKKQSGNPKHALRCFPRLPEDGEIRWDRSALEIDRLVRASSEPFPGAFSFLEGRKLTIWKAHVEKLPYAHLGVPGHIIERRKDGQIAVLTGKDVLLLETVQLKGQNRSAAADILHSTRQRLGLSHTQEILRLRAENEQLKEKIRELSGDKKGESL